MADVEVLRQARQGLDYVYPGAEHRSGCDARTALSQADYDSAAGAHTQLSCAGISDREGHLEYVILSHDLYDIIALQSRILQCDLGPCIRHRSQWQQISGFDHGKLSRQVETRF
jgi:hypothetical protein